MLFHCSVDNLDHDRADIDADAITLDERMIGFFGTLKDMSAFTVILSPVAGTWIFWYPMLNSVLWLKPCCSLLG